ncbi:MAG: hypothetical protein O3A51_14330 [Verrucomicrobia bacterium]|nr:hypothetical protein [Verrucomicrobiota bacterium]
MADRSAAGSYKRDPALVFVFSSKRAYNFSHHKKNRDQELEEILDYNGRFPPSAAPCWLLDNRAEDRRRAEMLRKAAPTSKYQYCDSNSTCFVTGD